MTKYNFFKQQVIEFYLQNSKIVDSPAGIFNLPAEHCDIGLINLIILESMASRCWVRSEITHLNLNLR